MTHAKRIQNPFLASPVPSLGSDFTVLPNGGLQISHAKVEDAGTYMCVAQNPAGTALGKTKLRVQGKMGVSNNNHQCYSSGTSFQTFLQNHDLAFRVTLIFS